MSKRRLIQGCIGAYVMSVAVPLMMVLGLNTNSMGMNDKGVYVVAIGLGFLAQTVLFLSTFLIAATSTLKNKILTVVLLSFSYVPLLYIFVIDHEAYLLGYGSSLVLLVGCLLVQKDLEESKV